MANDSVNTNIEQGVEDGAPKANWREPGQQTRSQVNQQSPSMRRTQGSTAGRKRGSMYEIADSHIGPHIVKGEKPHTPTIGEVLRMQHKKQRRVG